jgi:hypothetical protein
MQDIQNVRKAIERNIRSPKMSLGSSYIWPFGRMLSEIVAWILSGPREVASYPIERYVALVFLLQ